MLGQRAHIALLTSFFTFAFAMLFLALVQNYAHAGNHLDGSMNAFGAHLDSGKIYSFSPGLEVQYIEQPVFDFDSDDSYQRYLSTENPFHDMSYIPDDLVSIDSDFTANNANKFKLRQEAAAQFADMAWHFRSAFSGDRLYISSAYRSK